MTAPTPCQRDRSSYVKGCRCDACTQANTEYVAQYRSATRYRVKPCQTCGEIHRGPRCSPEPMVPVATSVDAETFDELHALVVDGAAPSVAALIRDALDAHLARLTESEAA